MKEVEKVDNHTSNFIKNIMIEDLETGKHDKSSLVFRQSQTVIYILDMQNQSVFNFGLADEFSGQDQFTF